MNDTEIIKSHVLLFVDTEIEITQDPRTYFVLRRFIQSCFNSENIEAFYSNILRKKVLLYVGHCCSIYLSKIG